MNLRIFVALFTLLLLSTIALAQEAVETKATPEFPTTEISFEESTFVFGDIMQGEVVQNVFVLTNTGDQPLVISQAKGSCGCTVPQWPKDPILPGESAQILAKFSSKGKSGKQSKRITLTANTSPAQTYLTIKGNILLPENTEAAQASVAIKPEINNLIDVNSIELFPNPTANVLNIRIQEYTDVPVLIDVFDQTGKLMTTKHLLKMEEGTIDLDVSDFPDGLYTVSVKLKDKMRVAKQVLVANKG